MRTMRALVPGGSPGQNGPSSVQPRMFYGWVIVASCTIISATTFGIRYSFGVFFKSLETDFAWSRAATSALFSVYMILAALFSVAGGWASDRYGPRPVALAMGTVGGLALLLTSRAESVWQLYLTYSFLLAMGTGATYPLLMSTGSRWFIRKRATALGIIGAGAGLGTIIMAPFSAWLISRLDWRAALVASAIIAWAIIVPTASLLKKDPADVGAQPDGEPVSASMDPGKWLPRQTSVTEAMRGTSFWLFFLIWFAYSFCLHTVISHVVPRAEDLGITPLQAASILSVMSGVTVPSRILIGRVSDRVDKRIPGITLALLHTAAMLWLIGCTRLWMFHVFAAVYGLAYGGLDPPLVASIAEIFGLRGAGAIMGTLVVGWGLGAAAGPYLSGLIFDITGGYRLAFLAGAAMMMLAAVAISRLRTPSSPHANMGAA